MISILQDPGLIVDGSPQNTPGWLKARRGVATGSIASAMRARTDGLANNQQRKFVAARRAGHDDATAKEMAGYKKLPTIENLDQHIAGTFPKEWSDTAKSAAMDVARELEGGEVPNFGEGGAARMGHEQEEFAAIAYTAQTGLEVQPVGFISTVDRKFGCSVDRLVVGVRAAIEVKTMVSSTTLFKVIVGGDVSEYLDQCLFAIWLLTLEWVDLCLWCPDLNLLHVVRIHRDEEQVQAMQDDAMAFAGLVEEYRAALRAVRSGQAPAPVPAPSPAAALPIFGEPVATPDDVPARQAAKPAPEPVASTPAAIPDFAF